MPLRPIALSVLLVLAAAGCGSGEAVDSPSAPSTENENDKPAAEGPDLSEAEFTDLTGEAEPTVDTRDNTFAPKYVEVTVGATVTWDNRGRTEHNVLPVEKGAFAEIATEDLEPGAQGTVTFTEAGDYPYYCSLHGTKTKGMVGAVRVLE